MSGPRVSVIGAGVAGLVAAVELAESGFRVEVLERAAGLGAQACAWMAGGMLAPWCEREGAEPEVTALGQLALRWWPRHYPGTTRRGTLVLAPPRDSGELSRFARRTACHEWLGAERIAELEPDLAGRFRQGLHFADEAHLDPRQALAALTAKLAGMGVPIRFGMEPDAASIDTDHLLDCRGLAARDTLAGLRGVRGEMVLVQSRDVALSRPVRLLHPRFPVYVVPRGEGLFMVGATLLESDAAGPVSVRSAVELLSAAYALHPAFGEARIVELGVGVRPAFADNLPHLIRRGRTTYLNGLYRHGFLLAPALGRRAAQVIAHAVATDPTTTEQCMDIRVNGTQHQIEASTLAAALDELGHGASVLATALNGRFVASTHRAQTPLSNGDEIEIVAPMQGG